MPTINAVVSCDVPDSFRVKQVSAMFDAPLTERSRASFRVEIPDESDGWSIGAIVGPSGSGKSTVARQAYGDRLYEPRAWPRDRAVIDGFGDHPTRTIAHTLTAVGFSSPPAWVRPYATLSNGERFRCDLARALLSTDGLVAFDEFTSVVDRTVAQVGAAAVAKAIRRWRVPAKRFVAVSCHYDILEWLQPDWTLDMATCQLARGRLQRPAIRLEIVRCRHDAWRLFSRHHYLNGALHRSAQCYLATWDRRPVCFAALLPAMGRRGHRRLSRLVTLPDYQGVGIGAAVQDAVAELYAAAGYTVSGTTGHPAMIRHLSRSPRWRIIEVARCGRKRQQGKYAAAAVSRGRAVVSFAYRSKARIA